MCNITTDIKSQKSINNLYAKDLKDRNYSLDRVFILSHLK